MEDHLGPNQCCLGGEVTQVKPKCSTYPFQCIQTFFFFWIQWNARSPPPEAWTSARVCCPRVTVWVSGVQGLWNQGQKWLELVHGPLQCPQPGLKPACLLPGAQVGNTSTGSHVTGAGHQFSQVRFYLWMMPKYLLLWWRGQKWGTSLYLGLKYILIPDKDSYVIAFCFRILLAVLSHVQWIGIGMGEDER